jgi:hypothetical protein
MTSDPADARVVVHPGDPDQVATILPGRGYTPDFPVLYYTRALLLARNWTVRERRWEALSADPTTWPRHVRHQALPALDLGGRATRRLVVGKSLGTHALPVAVEHHLPGIWLTPLLHDPEQVTALRRASASTLLVGGTADPYWDHEFAQELVDSGWSSAADGREVVELPGLDHSLEVPGDPQASVDALAALTRTLASFLDLLTTRAAETAPGGEQLLT